MTRHSLFAGWISVSLVLLGAAGCTSSAPDGGQAGNANNESRPVSGAEAGQSSDSPADQQTAWQDYSDVPYVPVMRDVDGIEIPRTKPGVEELQIKGEVPLDVGNRYAQQNPGEPATGDWLIVRFNSEPKTLNPIVETSAVQTYIGEYVNEPLMRLDPETLEYEPLIAERYVAEDSVKLAPDYPGKERRVALSGGQPAAALEIDFPESNEDKPAKITLHTFDNEGNRLANVWVGLYAVGDVPGAPASGYHFWSDKQGQVEVAAIVPGTYEVRVGAEIFGKAVENDDGSLTVTPESPDNPLSEQFGGQSAVTLEPDEWNDVQHESIYTYFLRPEVRWSDGTPFTTRDLQFAYAVINNPYVDGESIRVYYQDLIRCDALDEHTVRMQYRQQYFKSFEFTMGLSFFAPPWHQFAAFFEKDGKTLTLERLTPEQEEAQNKVSAHGQQFGKFFNTDDRYNLRPLGTGPYVVDQWVRADRVELRRNPGYWNQERKPYLDRLIFKFIPDNVTALQALKAGQIDFMYRMNPEQYFEDLSGPPDWFRENYVRASWYSPSFSYVGWNMLKPMFQDRRVRIALALLFNKQEFLEKKLHGAGALVSGSQYYFSPFYDHTVAPIGYDPETARDLLADAGWIDSDGDGVLDKDGKPFRFTLWMPIGNPVVEDQMAVMQRGFKEVGIQMEIRKTEWASFIEKVKARDFDAVRLGWAQPLESDPFQIWHGSQAGADKRGSNHVSFSDPLADELIEMVRMTLDEEKRKRIHWSFHRILDREQPYMFLYVAKEFGAYHKRFRGVKWYKVRPGFDFTEWYVPKGQQAH